MLLSLCFISDLAIPESFSVILLLFLRYLPNSCLFLPETVQFLFLPVIFLLLFLLLFLPEISTSVLYYRSEKCLYGWNAGDYCK